MLVFKRRVFQNLSAVDSAKSILYKGRVLERAITRRVFFPPDKRLITDSVFFAKESYFRGDNSTDYRSLLGFVSSVFRERERERETETET